MNGAVNPPHDPYEREVFYMIHRIAVIVTYRYMLDWVNPDPYKEFQEYGGEG